MSIKRDVNGYKIFDLPSGSQLLWAEEDQVLFTRPNESCTPLTTDFDDHYDEILEGWEQAIVELDRLAGRMEQSHRDAVHARVKQENAEEERDKAIQDLRDYKAKRGENIGGMLDARAETDQLRRELEEASNNSLERSLLEMWSASGIEEIYKYKNRIKVYKREGLVRYELFTDLTYRLFADVEDTANYRDATPEDFKMRVDVLLAERKGEVKA